jgi:hypothetical protein
VQINEGIHNCASRARVVGRMASQAWVAERAFPHALAIITTMRQPNMDQYVDNYYSVEKL